MNFEIISLSNRQPDWIEAGYSDYAKRMPADFSLQHTMLKAEPRTQGKTTAQIMAAEALRITTHLKKDKQAPYIVVLDEFGQRHTTVQFADTIQRLQLNWPKVVFIIGGADGLDATIKNLSHAQIRISDFTLPHGMVRLMLAEQLYRVWSLHNNHPYHRS
jgi:23S rRNA (pseudouridine1915-N3)-methyltransferase